MSATIHAADLFAGAGGFSSGLLAAARKLGRDVDLLAINHWQVAIDTHARDHPGVRHLCKSIESVNPSREVPGGKLRLLLASPECVHHSNARGGKPMSDQSRATAWHLLHWLETVDVEHVLIENVSEFQSWGPLYPADHADEKKRLRPIERQKGRYFRLFLKNLQTLGYRVDYRVLNAADYGDATSRRRLFIQARKGRRPIVWPEPTHRPAAVLQAETGQGNLDLAQASTRPWRAARDVIDWSLPGTSIFGRERPLAPNTLARICAGLRKFSGLPFLVPYRGERDGQEPRGHSVAEPLPTVTTYAGHALVEPFVVVLRNHCDALPVDAPLPTLAAQGGHVGLCEPYVVVNRAHGSGPAGCAHALDVPIRGLTTGGNMGLARPFIVPLNHGAGDLRAHDVDAPMKTITSVDAWGFVEPFLLPHRHGGDEAASDQIRDLERPLPTVTGTSSDMFLVEPYLIKSFEGSDAASVDAPVPTVTANYEHLALAQPFLIKYHGSDDDGHSVDAPLATVTGRDRFGLVEPRFYEAAMGAVVGFLDIKFRMLQPHELAAAMGFPRDYQFTGTREQQVKQIGNAVAVNLATALCEAILR